MLRRCMYGIFRYLVRAKLVRTRIPFASTLAPRERPCPHESQLDKSPSQYSEMKKKFVILLSISLIVLSQDGRSICAVILVFHHEGFALDCTPSQAVVTQLAVCCISGDLRSKRVGFVLEGSATTSRRGSLVFRTIHLKFSTIRSPPQAHFPSILQCEKNFGRAGR